MLSLIYVLRPQHWKHILVESAPQVLTSDANCSDKNRFALNLMLQNKRENILYFFSVSFL